MRPEELAKVIREMPRNPEVVEMLKKFSGVDPLPRISPTVRADVQRSSCYDVSMPDRSAYRWHDCITHLQR